MLVYVCIRFWIGVLGYFLGSEFLCTWGDGFVLVSVGLLVGG